MDSRELYLADSKIADLLEVLTECEDYLDNRADVLDGEDGLPRPNAAMSLLGRVQIVLDRCGR